MTDRFVALHGRATSLVIELTATTALWRHWGARLPDGVAIAPLARAIPSFSLDRDIAPSVFPTFGMGWFGESALLAHRDGRDFAQCFTEVRAAQATRSRLDLILVDDIAQIEVAVALSLDPDSDVLTVATSLTNTGGAALEVQRLAAASFVVASSATHVRSWGGRHNAEFGEDAAVLGASTWRRENRRGLTSHQHFPGAVVLGDDGSAWGAQLAWSGNHAQSIAPLDDGSYQWQLGEWLAPGEVRLAPGETLTSPEVLATFSPDGAGGVARNFHAAVRNRMSWPGDTMRPRPVHLNTWEAVYFGHDEDDLRALAAAAATIGVERFVLDDGWFGRRDDDTSSLGDWTVDARKYPKGLGSLADHVTALGMEFGLWVEPEMVSPDSALFRAHPDWALQIAGRDQITARNQLVLDLSRRDVGDYLFAALSRLLDAFPIGYLKWDHNRALASAAGADGRPSYRRQVLGTYALIDRIRAAFPAVEIESCAGGGGRIDAAIATRTHRFWTSDNNDAAARVAIQRGFLQFMPPELMGAHIGASPAHSTGRRHAIDFRALVALPGHLGVELDPRRLSAADRERLAAWIARYKDLRGAVHDGEVYFGTTPDGAVWQAHGGPDAILLFVYRTTPRVSGHGAPLALPMLDADATYRVEWLFPAGPSETVSGGWLVAHGLSVDLSLPDTAALSRISLDRS